MSTLSLYQLRGVAIGPLFAEFQVGWKKHARVAINPLFAEFQVGWMKHARTRTRLPRRTRSNCNMEMTHHGVRVMVLEKVQ
jgi:hypothetical protein